MPNQSQDYKKIKLLGQGTYGKAFLVERKSDNVKCVIKQIEMIHMTEDERKEAQKEANILQMLDHHNIIKYHEQYKTKKGRLCIVMDYAEGGDLNQYISKARSNIPEEIILNWLIQLSCALNYINSKNIIHRDIKAQNVFLSSNNIVKLADFGISRILACTIDKAQTFIGTPYYLAPELVDSKPYSTKADIWSLGVLIYQLCALKPPFEAESITSLMLKISRGQYTPIPSIYSKELRNLIHEMLTVDADKRPSALQIIEKPFIKSRAVNFLSETIALQAQQEEDQSEKNQFNQQHQQQVVQQKQKKGFNIILENDRKYGFKDIQKNGINNNNGGQARFFSPQHNEQRGHYIGFNNNNQQNNGNQNAGEKQSYNELPIISAEDLSNYPKTKIDVKNFKGQEEYYQQNNPNYNGQGAQEKQEKNRQLYRVGSLNEFSNNKNHEQNKIKQGIAKQSQYQQVMQENNQLQQQDKIGILNQNQLKKPFRLHSPVHTKISSPNSRFLDNKQSNNYFAYNQIPNSDNQNNNYSNENLNTNQDYQNINNNKQYQDPSSGLNIQKASANNNYIQNYNNLNNPLSFNNIDLKPQYHQNSNAVNNVPSSQNRIGSPGTRLPQLNYQPPPAKVKHTQNYSAVDKIQLTPQLNQRRNLEKIQKPYNLQNKNSEIPSPVDDQRPISAMINFGSQNNLQKQGIHRNLNYLGQGNQDGNSPNSNLLNKLNQNSKFQYPNSEEILQSNQINHRQHLQSAHPSSQQQKLNRLQKQALQNNQLWNNYQNQQQQPQQQQQQQSTKETSKSDESSDTSQDDIQQIGSQNQLGKQFQQAQQAQQQNQQKKFVIKKGAAQGGIHQITSSQNLNQISNNQLSNNQSSSNQLSSNQISSNQRIPSQPSEDHQNQAASQNFILNTQSNQLVQNIQLSCVDTDTSQKNTPKNEYGNETQTTINSHVINTQQIKKSEFNQMIETQESIYQEEQNKQKIVQSQQELEDAQNQNAQGIKSIKSADNILKIDSQFSAVKNNQNKNIHSKILKTKNILQSASKQEFSENKQKRKDSESDEDIRLFYSVDSQNVIKTPVKEAIPSSQFVQNSQNVNNNQQNITKIPADDIDYHKKQSPLISSRILNPEHDKETKVERKLIVRLPLPFQEQKDKDRRKIKMNEISPERIKDEEQETDLEKMLNELNQMLTGNYDEQIQKLNTNHIEFNTIEDKEDDLDEEEFSCNFNNNNNINNFVSSPLNNLSNNQRQINFALVNIPSNISCIAPSNQNKYSKLNAHNNQQNQSVSSKQISHHNQNQSEIIINSEDRVKQLKQFLEKEIGTIHFSKVYKLAVATFSNIQQPIESNEFCSNLKIMFPSISNQDVQRYTTLFHTLVMFEQD